jgi:lipoprotein-releasing system ATP-binding protein
MGHLKTLGMEKHALKNQFGRRREQRDILSTNLVIMGDEPTGNLDRKNGDLVFDIFNKLGRF